MNMDFEQFADQFTEEVMSEAAENFFGTRKQAEEALETFDRLVDELERKEQEVADKGCFLNFLLRRGWAVNAFYRVLGVEPDAFPFFSLCSTKKSFERSPTAFTARGKFIKFVHKAYDVFQEACRDFLHGTHYEDENGRKRVTVHFEQVLAFGERLDQEIERLNRDSSVSGVLRFAKNLDPAGEQRERVAGGTLEDHGSLDESMKLPHPDLTGLHRMRMPELPRAEEVHREITCFCKEVYSEHKDEIDQILDRLKEENS